MNETIHIPGFSVEKPLGAGATAETYLARDERRGGRPVALKVFHSEWVERYRDLIEHEFHLLASLQHPGLVAIEDFGFEESRCYLVSEFISGSPFLPFLQGRDLNALLWYAAQILETLDYLSFRGVVHLDLKPENVLIETGSPSGESRARLLDFGLASMALHDSNLEGTLGSPPFTAPEFAVQGFWDERSDLYSLGAMLFTALTGKPLFPGENPLEILNHQINFPPPSLSELRPDLSSSLCHWVDRLLSADPEGRPAGSREALRELHEALGSENFAQNLAPPPLLEDATWSFRSEAELAKLETCLSREGVAQILGPKGAGKSFLARRLQKALWSRQERALLLRGPDLALLQAHPEFQKLSLLVDDADTGPVLPWLREAKFRRCLLFGTKPLAGWEVPTLRLESLRFEVFRDSLNRRVRDVPETVAQRWFEAAEGRPEDLLRRGRQGLRDSAFVFEHGAWRWEGRPEWPRDIPAEDLEKTLLDLLAASAVTLDAATLSHWLALSQQETQELLDKLHMEERLEKVSRSGQFFYQARPGEKGSFPRNESSALMALWEASIAQGKCAEGLEAFRHYRPAGPCDRVEVLLYGELLAGANRYSELAALFPEVEIAAWPDWDQGQARLLLGKADLFQGRGEEAEAHLTAARHCLREGASLLLGKVYLHLGILAQRRGAQASAEAWLKQAEEEGKKNPPSLLLQGTALLNLANLIYERGDYRGAQTRYEAALLCLSETHHGPMLAQAALNLAQALFYQGKVPAAERRAREALRLAILHRFPLAQGYALLLLGLIDRSRGNSARQGRRLAEALEIFASGALLQEWMEAKLQQAHLLADEGQAAASAEAAEAALEEAFKQKSPDLEAKARLLHGRIIAERGQASELAEGHLIQARRHFHEKGHSDLLWRTEFEWGKLCASQGRKGEAREHFQRAVATLEDFCGALSEEAREAYLRDGKRRRLETELEALGGEE